MHDCLLQKIIMQSKVWDALFSVSAQNRVSTHSSLAMGWYSIYLPIFSESNVRDFCLIMPGFQKQPKNFWQFSKYIWMLHKIFLKMFQLHINISTAPIWSSCLVPEIKMQSESNSFSVFWYTSETQSTLHAFLEHFKDMELNFFIDHVFKNKIFWMCEPDVKNKYCLWWVRMMSVVPRHVTQA